MNNFVKFGLAAAAIVVVVVAGIKFLPGTTGPGGSIPAPATAPPSPTLAPTPSLTPVPTPTPIALTAADISDGTPEISKQPGTYRIAAPFAVPFNVTFDTEWQLTGVQEGMANLGKSAKSSGLSAYLNVLLVENVYADPCNPDAGTVQTQTIQTVDGLVAAMTNISGWEAGPISDATRGGYSGKTFVLTPPGSRAPSSCNGGLPALVTYRGQTEPAGTNTDLTAEMTVIDVNGTPVLIWEETGAALIAADHADVRTTSESIRFE